MSSSLQSTVLVHPKRYFLPFAGLTAAVSLNLTPSFTSLIVLVTTLRLYVQLTVHRPERVLQATYMVISLAVGSALGNIAPALGALSTPAMSIFMLSFVSLLQSGVAMIILTADAYVSNKLYRSSWLRFIAFPTIWATMWTIISHVSPFGRLFVWTPVQGLQIYNWTIPIFGAVGIDWLVAAWSVTLADIAGTWFMGTQDEEEEEPSLIDVSHGTDLPVSTQNTSTRIIPSRKVASLGIFLALATVPSFVIRAKPLPVSSTYTTPIAVGCVLPSRIYDKPSDDALDTFITASQKMTSANVLLWPENAVSFSSADAKDAAFERIRTSIPGPFIGVGFEVPVPANPGERAGRKRNGFALIGPQGVVIEYYKKNLVPFTESFSYLPSDNPSPLYTLELRKPASSHIPKNKWAPGPSYTRPVPITAAICLDFASPTIFSSLTSRPALILAPGKTWDVSMGVAMWEQAKSRAEELGSTVLWCDAGGVSGIASAGSETEFSHIGEGSWIKTVALRWPFDDSRTLYAYGSDWVVTAFFIALLAAGSFGRFGVSGMRRINVAAWYQALRKRIGKKPARDTEPPLLN